MSLIVDESDKNPLRKRLFATTLATCSLTKQARILGIMRTNMHGSVGYLAAT